MQKFGLDEKIISDIIEILKKYEEVESAKIYGSRARGDYRKSSDIDIALFGDNLTFSIHTNIFYEIDNLYLPYKIDLINFNSISLANKIRENIIREGVEFYAK
ncbi:MAG: nucleotidyltransferase domain-containing protein [Clostridia bacterium]|nr:nucleotidyltransferase domain-containing protein [Clostridia bacterium]